MTDTAFYRAEAKRLRESAARCASPEQAQQFLRFAHDNDTLADLMEASNPTSEPREPGQPDAKESK
jgi:hypothetical protein